jgi:hypothetical protein
MDNKTLIDKAILTLRNADQETRLYDGLPEETIRLINPYFSTLKLPPLPEDYLQFLRQANGCMGRYFYLYGIEKIDAATGVIESCIIDDAPHFNRYEEEDDIEDKGLILGYMSARMMLVYKHKQYLILDQDSYCGGSDLYHHIADFITETVTAADASARRRATEKS